MRDIVATLRLCLLIMYFLLQTSFEGPFHTNGTFKGKLAIFHSILHEATKVIHHNIRIIINGMTNLKRYNSIHS